MNRYTPYRWRVTVEYVSYDQAKMAMDMLRNTGPDVFVFDALNHDGEPLWHERGQLHFRPERDK